MTVHLREVKDNLLFLGFIFGTKMLWTVQNLRVTENRSYSILVENGRVISAGRKEHDERPVQ